jgi:hypothetical protein
LITGIIGGLIVGWFAGAMVRGLREGSSAQFRMVQGQAVAAGKMGTATGETDMGAAGMPGGGLVPSDDHIAIAHATEAPLVRAAAAGGLEVHNYGRVAHANVGDPLNAVGAAQGAGLGPTYGEGAKALMGRRAGRTKAPEFRSHTQDPAVLGAHPDRTFGSVGEHAGPRTGGLSMGTKSIRASTLADGGDDVMTWQGAFDGIGASLTESGFRRPMSVGV